MVSQFCLFWCFFVLSVSARSGSLSAFVFFKIILGRFMPLFGVCEEKQKIKGRRGGESIHLFICSWGWWWEAKKGLFQGVLQAGHAQKTSRGRHPGEVLMLEPSQLAIFDAKEQQLWTPMMSELLTLSPRKLFSGALFSHLLPRIH